MLLETIAQRTKVPVATLANIAASASKRYKEYTIPKRTGGVRLISHPGRPLKALQRWLTRHLLADAPIHGAATAYQKGASIKENALRHAGSSYTIRLDFTDFFPSFDANSISQYLTQYAEVTRIPLSKQDIDFVVRIFCKDGRITIGAPSSPKITNAIMFTFDEQVADFADSRGVTYTRYADDLFLSAFDLQNLLEVEKFVRDAIANHRTPRLRLNEEKTLYLSKAGHRSVTGIVLTPEGKISLGRPRKREIKSLIFKAMSNNLNPVERGYLAGLISFCHDIEPDFIGSLARKYEIDVLTWAKSL